MSAGRLITTVRNEHRPKRHRRYAVTRFMYCIAHVAIMATSNQANSKKRLRSTLFCGHCNRSVPHSTFYRHKVKYYNEISNTWIQNFPDSSSESDFDDSCTLTSNSAHTTTGENDRVARSS